MPPPVFRLFFSALLRDLRVIAKIRYQHLCRTFAFFALWYIATSLAALPETECEGRAIMGAYLEALAPDARRQVIEERAKRGERAAQVGLGMALEGKEAHKWLETAVENESLFAIVVLNRNFASQAFRSEDAKTKSELEFQAARWAAEGARLGQMDMQREVGDYLWEGRGIPKNEVLAVRWWKEAAENGSTFAQNSLAIALFEGRGTIRNEIEALQWAILVRQKIPPSHGYRIPIADIATIKQKMPAPDIAKAEKNANKWNSRFLESEKRKHDSNERECGVREFDKGAIR